MSTQSLLFAFCSVMVEPAAGVAADVVRGIAAAANKSSTPEEKKDRRVAFKRIPLKVFASQSRRVYGLGGWRGWEPLVPIASTGSRF